MSVRPANQVPEIALAGMGGYAGQMLNRMLGWTDLVRLSAVCDPSAALRQQYEPTLRSQGITVDADFAAMLRRPGRRVWLPVPIDLHRPFTEAALAAGRHVLCEKPIAGSLADVDAIIAARDRHRHVVCVAFQHAYDPAIAALHRQLLGGRIGNIEEISLIGAWPRGDQYFIRNDWAGRWKRGNVWVQDSPANNALAHGIHLGLMLASDTATGTAEVVAMHAELYRVNPIETFDTCSLRAKLSTGATFLCHLTHACQRSISPRITIKGSRGSLSVTPGHDACWHDRDERVPLADGDAARRHMLRQFIAATMGKPLDGMIVSLESARAQTRFITAVANTSAPCDVPPEFVLRGRLSSGEPIHQIQGIEAAILEADRQGMTFHELGSVPWSRPPEYSLPGPNAPKPRSANFDLAPQ